MKTWHEASTSGYCSRELKRNSKVVYTCSRGELSPTPTIGETERFSRHCSSPQQSQPWTKPFGTPNILFSHGSDLAVNISVKRSVATQTLKSGKTHIGCAKSIPSLVNQTICHNKPTYLSREDILFEVLMKIRVQHLHVKVIVNAAAVYSVCEQSMNELPADGIRAWGKTNKNGYRYSDGNIRKIKNKQCKN